jgi:hypothetical protein
MESLKKKYTLTFYRRMANTNPEIMKRYKSAVINGMSFKQLVKIYTENNLIFEKDISRLLLFKHSDQEVELKINSDQEIELKTNSDQDIDLKINSKNYIESIILSDPIIKKYPYIKQNSVIYTILNTNTNIKPKNNKTKCISLFESIKQFFLDLR